MQPGSALANSVAALVAGDVNHLATATAPKVHLASAAFTPSLSLLVSNLTEATFVGYAALAVGTAGVQLQFFDPATGNGIVELKAPANGWLFQTTSATGLPQTIFGSYVTDNGSAALYGSQLLPSAVTLTQSGQGIELAPQRFIFPPSPMT